MSREECAGPSGETKMRKKGNKGPNLVGEVTGWTPGEVKFILKIVEPNHSYISSSEEEPFVDNGSEYITLSGPESEDREPYQISDEVHELNIPEDNELQENETLIVGKLLDQKDLKIIWTKNKFNPHVHKFDLTNAGLQNQDLTETTKEVDYFRNLFTEEITEVIVQETNR